jgi:hypothetical protein
MERVRNDFIISQDLERISAKGVQRL